MSSVFHGRALNLTVRGASHSPRIEFTLTGLPASFRVDRVRLAAFMRRRAPGAGADSTPRKETDAIHFTGETSGFILNENARPGDYGANRTVPRPGHADFPQFVRFGRIPTGGGANSGRLTAAFCAAGGMCLQFLAERGVTVAARIVECGDIAVAKAEGDSVGAVIECTVTGLATGYGGAMFDGLDGAIAALAFAVPGVKGVEFGNGFAAAELRGSENNDAFEIRDGEVRTATNRHGGVLGGFSSGMPIVFRVAMKPTPTIFKPQQSVDLVAMTPTELKMQGRHDPCIAVRAVPVIEAVTALALADVILDHEQQLPRICLTLTGATLAENRAQYFSQRLFTDMVELRLDLLEAIGEKRLEVSETGRDGEGERSDFGCAPDVISDEFLDEIGAFVKEIKVPVLLTCRRERDGGAWKGDEAARAELMRRVLARGGFSYVDLEDDFHLLDDFVRDGSIGRARTPAAPSGVNEDSTNAQPNAAMNFRQDVIPVVVVRSAHAFDGTMPTVHPRADEIAKVAFKPQSLEQIAALFTRPRRNCRGEVVMAMGGSGFLTRALASQLRSEWVYASVGGLESLGQISPEELVRDFRFRDAAVAGRGEIFGVTGWPLKKTRSPELHNAAFFAEDRDAVMVPLPWPEIADVLAFMRALPLRGLAVTIPHKEKILPLLDEVDEAALAVGAVNTVRNDGGRLVGFNTDVAGFSRAVSEFYGASLTGLRVALLGNGGAAKACRFALKALGCGVETFHRRSLNGFFPLIVNATPVDPIPDYCFRGDECVFDLRYVPAETELMARAAAAGCRVENGFSMLRYQAEEQRRIWTPDEFIFSAVSDGFSE